MKKLIILIYFIFFVQGVCSAQDFQVIERFLNDNPRQKYLIQLPKDYSLDKTYPLFIAIHWFKGNAKQQVDEWKFFTNKEKYILLCPEFRNGYQRLKQAEDKKLIQIIKEAKKRFSIDGDNIFLVGYSGGAQFVHRFAFKHPEHIKAACVLAGGEYDTPPNSDRARKVTYFIAVGEEDERYRKTLNFYNQLKKRHYKAKFEAFPLIGHNMHFNIKSAVIVFLR
jgi:predicted esterase